MITMTICDDDIQMLKYLDRFVTENYPDIKTVTFQQEKDLKNYYLNNLKQNIDILLIDIRLQKENGIQLASELKKMHPETNIILLTGYVDYVRDIFDTEPVYFLLKPIDEGKLRDAIEKASNRLVNTKKYVKKVVTKEGIRVIDLEQVVYVESQGRYLHIYGTDAQWTIRSKIKDFIGEREENFLYPHQSYAVNMSFIEKFGVNEIDIGRPEKIPLSRSKSKSAKEQFMNYLEKRL